MRAKIYMTFFGVGLIAMLALAVVVIFQAPVGWKFFGFRDIPADRRVPWIQPPGRFEPKGGRVTSASTGDVPGGFLDFASRTLNFRGLVADFSPDWKAPSPGVAFDRLRGSGINVITVPVRWQDLEPAPTQVSVDVILAIRSFLDAAGARGIGVILVNTTPFSGDTACKWAPDAPMWAWRLPPRQSTGEGFVCQEPESRDIDAAAIFRTDFIDGRWTPDNTSLQDHLIRSWTKLAEVASRSPGLIGYGLADSMACPADLESDACTRAWTGYIDRFANGVRAVDGSALFFFDTDAPETNPVDGTVIVSEIVPGTADDSTRGPLMTLPPGTFTLDHKRTVNGVQFLETIDAIERRGRSWLIRYPATRSGRSAVTTGVLPNALEMARPRPEAVAGRNVKFNFDRLSLPSGPEDSATEPGTTDVFTLEFDDAGEAGAGVTETTVWLPVKTLYRHPSNQDAPGWIMDISDGSVNWLPGRTDVVLWRTIEGNGPHRMKIIPWGGRRLISPAMSRPDQHNIP